MILIVRTNPNSISPHFFLGDRPHIQKYGIKVKHKRQQKTDVVESRVLAKHYWSIRRYTAVLLLAMSCVLLKATHLSSEQYTTSLFIYTTEYTMILKQQDNCVLLLVLLLGALELE